MNNTISDIGKTRLEKILFKEKASHPSRICEVLKSDIKSLMRNYAELDGDIKCDVDTDLEGFVFNVSFHAIRLKSFGTLPDNL